MAASALGLALAAATLHAAWNLLLAREAPIDEIAAQTGYSTVYAFATAFR